MLLHELGHAIFNIIMNEFGGNFNGVNFNSLSKEEKSDWTIRLTNTLRAHFNEKMETGEGQHDRKEYEEPKKALDPLKN